jgi:hypothetical protein
MGGGSISDDGGSKSDMPDSNPDMGGSFSDMGGSNPDNNTILIHTHLNEPGYVDAGLPTQRVLASDKLKQVKGVYPFAAPLIGSGKGTSVESA